MVCGAIACSLHFFPHFTQDRAGLKKVRCKLNEIRGDIYRAALF